jgi:hypothetical protein
MHFLQLWASRRKGEGFFLNEVMVQDERDRGGIYSVIRNFAGVEVISIWETREYVCE